MMSRYTTAISYPTKKPPWCVRFYGHAMATFFISRYSVIHNSIEHSSYFILILFFFVLYPFLWTVTVIFVPFVNFFDNLNETTPFAEVFLVIFLTFFLPFTIIFLETTIVTCALPTVLTRITFVFFLALTPSFLIFFVLAVFFVCPGFGTGFFVGLTVGAGVGFDEGDALGFTLGSVEGVTDGDGDGITITSSSLPVL